MVGDHVIVCWLNASPDPHYQRTVTADASQLSVLSTLGDTPATVLTDCLDEPDTATVTFKKVRPIADVNPYFARWQHIADHLAGVDGFVWSVDASDVRMLNPAFPKWMRPGVLYIGSEPVAGKNARSVGFWWVKQLHPDHAAWIRAHASLPLLNAGILGGDAATVREFAAELAAATTPNDKTDMAAANELAYGDDWRGRVVTGPMIHSEFWSFATSDPHAVWAHK